MSQATQMAELTRVITCQQKLDQIRALLAKGEKRTLQRRREEWASVLKLSDAQLESFAVMNPVQPELPVNEIIPPSQ